MYGGSGIGFTNLYPGVGVREWQYWTRNKLEILAGYLPAFNTACQQWPDRVYIDLMAGEPVNVDAATGTRFDGSARLALGASPPFTRLAFCEMPETAVRLAADLRQVYPGRHVRVYPGDCNTTIDEVLADLAPWRRMPTFVFVDQQAAEIRWETLAKIARFRADPRKAEIWILMSPAMIAKGVAGTNGSAFAARVDALFGNDTWRRIQTARRDGSLGPEEYRDEMVNLLRWQLEHDLRYGFTARIPMNMPNNMPIYDMVFATDVPVGNKIMTHLYRLAAEREPRMIQEARVRSMNQRDEKAGRVPLFDLDPVDIPVSSLAWEPSACWDPSGQAWW